MTFPVSPFLLDVGSQVVKHGLKETETASVGTCMGLDLVLSVYVIDVSLCSCAFSNSGNRYISDSLPSLETLTPIGLHCPVSI